MEGIAQTLIITWLGHSTVLMETGGTRLLTDPLLVPWLGHLRRVAAEPAPVEVVDAVLVSHVHHDHLDFASLRRLHSPRLVVPAGAGRLLARRGYREVVELDAGEHLTIGGLTVQAIPVEHRAQRGPFAARIPSLGYLISGPGRVFFAGDTDVFPEMSELEPDLDVALLPVAGWGPRVGPGHLDPRKAAQALRLLRPHVAIPIHWGTYRRVGLKRDAATLREPPERFARLAAEEAPEVAVLILDPGESAMIPLPTSSLIGEHGR